MVSVSARPMISLSAIDLIEKERRRPRSTGMRRAPAHPTRVVYMESRDASEDWTVFESYRRAFG
jgi:hypothetical protein